LALKIEISLSSVIGREGNSGSAPTLEPRSQSSYLTKRKGFSKPFAAFRKGGVRPALFTVAMDVVIAQKDPSDLAVEIRAAREAANLTQEQLADLARVSIWSIRSWEQSLRERGILDEKGNVKPVVEVEGRLRREAADHAEALGMTPRARAKIGMDLIRAEVAAQGVESDREARARLAAASRT
jgi:transcriptional regulator with XRE-family HTH domain